MQTQTKRVSTGNQRIAQTTDNYEHVSCYRCIFIIFSVVIIIILIFCGPHFNQPPFAILHYDRWLYRSAVIDVKQSNQSNQSKGSVDRKPEETRGRCMIYALLWLLLFHLAHLRLLTSPRHSSYIAWWDQTGESGTQTATINALNLICTLIWWMKAHFRQIWLKYVLDLHGIINNIPSLYF